MASRPKYHGIPQRVQDEVTVRRRRLEETAPPPVALAPPPSSPLTMEARLKAMEKAIAALAAKMDLVLDVLTGADDVPGANPPAKAKRPKAT